MTTEINTVKNTEVDAGYEVSKFTLGVGVTMSALIGIWGLLCLINAFATNGPVAIVKNYLNALFGL